MSRYAIKSATLTFNSTTYDMASGPAGKSETREAVDVTALSDTIKQFIPGAIKETDEFTVTLYCKSTGDITVDTAPAAASIAVVLEDGSGTDANASVAFTKVIPTKVSYSNQDASGDRKGTYDVTFRPDGTAATNSGNL